MNVLEMAKNAALMKADAEATRQQFDPAWLVAAIAAQLKKAAIAALANDPKIEALAEKLGTDVDNARILWNAFLQHLKEDF